MFLFNNFASSNHTCVYTSDAGGPLYQGDIEVGYRLNIGSGTYNIALPHTLLQSYIIKPCYKSEKSF